MWPWPAVLYNPPEEGMFIRFWGHLVTMFGGCAKQSKSSVASTGMKVKVNQIKDLGTKLLKNSRQHQNKIDEQEAQINSLQSKNEQLRGLLDLKLLVDAIGQAVTISLKVNSQPVNKGGAGNNGTGYITKPYLETH